MKSTPTGAFMTCGFVTLLAGLPLCIFGGRELPGQNASAAKLPYTAPNEEHQNRSHVSSRRKTRGESARVIILENDAEVRESPAANATDSTHLDMQVNPKSLASVDMEEKPKWTKRNFGFCGYCADGKIFQFQKNQFISGVGFKRIFIKVLDETKHGVYDGKVSMSWDYEDFNDLEGQERKRCDAARLVKHTPKPSTFAEENTDEVIEKIGNCMKAKELCGPDGIGEADDQGIHYVTEDDQAQECFRKFQKVKQKLGDETEEDEEEERQEKKARRGIATMQSIPSWTTGFALLVTLLSAVTSPS